MLKENLGNVGGLFRNIQQLCLLRTPLFRSYLIINCKLNFKSTAHNNCVSNYVACLCCNCFSDLSDGFSLWSLAYKLAIKLLGLMSTSGFY